MSYVHHQSACVRKLWPGEPAEYLALLLRLDPQTRRERFGEAVTETYMREHVQRTVQIASDLFGAFVGDRLRGVAELCPVDAGQVAEAAFVVEREYQKGGIGTALFAATLRSARNQGYRSVTIACLRTNWSMRSLAMKAEAELMLTFDEMRVHAAAGGSGIAV